MRVDHVERGCVERAGYRAASQHRGGEARTFFVAERDDLDGEGQAAALQCRDAFDAEHDAKRTVILATVADAVDVAADDQRGGIEGGGFVAADEVGGGVYADLHAGFRHPRSYAVDRCAVRWRKIAAVEGVGQVAVGRSAEFVAAGDRARAARGEGVHHADTPPSLRGSVAPSSRPSAWRTIAPA